MPQDDGQLILAALIGFGGGLYTFAKGFRVFRKYRVVADTPAIPIRSAPMGLVHVTGRAQGESVLSSPVTHTPCFVYQVVVEQWHSESKGGGEWKQVATDIKSVKFDLVDGSGRVPVDAEHAELDLPANPIRKVRSQPALGAAVSAALSQGEAGGSGRPATDNELLHYIEQARVRHMSQMIGKGVGLISHGNETAHRPGPQAFMNFLSDPFGSGAADFGGMMMKATLAQKDPTGKIPRLALEVWKYPQGSPEYESALVQVGQAYLRLMNPAMKQADAGAILMYVRQQPHVMGMIAMAAASNEPQADPESEKARQAAMAFSHESVGTLSRQSGATASGHFRLTEYCLVPGQVYNITGTCAENPNPRDEHDRNMILKGTNEPTFLISSRAEGQIEAGLRRRAAWMVLGGAAVAIISLAILLGKAGLL